MVTREDGLANGSNIRPERILKFDLATQSQTENLFYQNDFASKQLHIINNELIVIGGQFVNRYPLDFSTEPSSVSHGLNITRHGMAVLDDEAYIVGGDLDLDGDQNIEAEKIYSFNLNSNTLSFEASMPENRFGGRATIVNNKLFVFGGTSVQFGENAENTIYIIDLDTNEVVTENMPTNLHYSYVDKFENLIYVAGRIENFDADGVVIGRSPYLGVYNTEDGSMLRTSTELLGFSAYGKAVLISALEKGRWCEKRYLSVHQKHPSQYLDSHFLEKEIATENTPHKQIHSLHYLLILLV